jgi:hypothetical protein
MSESSRGGMEGYGHLVDGHTDENTGDRNIDKKYDYSSRG